MTIEALKHRWKKDKEFFKNKEIGELQNFVREVLQEKELFNLRQGNLAELCSADEHRTNEFTIETTKKSGYLLFLLV